MRVAPAAASIRLKKADKDLATIARELNVRYIVEGRVRKAGQSIRITAQLVDVAEDRTIWADKYAGEFEHVFELQERVSRAIAEVLQLTLRASVRVPKPAAVEAFLKGRHFLRQATSAGFQKALEYFADATLLDPDYAPPFAALGETYVTLTTAWETLPALETMPKAVRSRYCNRQLSKVFIRTHTSPGTVHFLRVCGETSGSSGSLRRRRHAASVSRRELAPELESDVASRPIIGPTTGVSRGKNHDVFVCDLIRNRERKAIEHRDPPVWTVAPLRCCFGKSKDHRERRVDLASSSVPRPA